jgi:hypothetical protein
MIYTYIISIIDTVTQEPRHIEVKGDELLLKVMKARPEHHVLTNTENCGPLESAEDYIKEQEGKA